MCAGRAVVVLALLALTAGPGVGVGSQVPSGAAALRAAVERAFRAGRFDEVERLAQGASSDEALVVLRARALAARGDDQRAEALLRPVAAKNPVGDAALELGLLQQRLGRRAEARRTLQLVLLSDVPSPTVRDYVRVARAARALGRFEDANASFRDAVALAPGDVVANTEWGELFLEKYNRKDAARSFQEALKSDPDYGPALVGMARALADDNPPEALRFVARALERNPSDVSAHLFVAEAAMDRDNRQEARAAVARALEVNPRSLEALSLRAALAYLEGRQEAYEQDVAAVLAIHPTYGEIFRVVGSVTARAYRFDDAAELARRAIALDRENARAYADLGAHLMRTGDERNARRVLETAFQADPYDVVTYNLLNLLDTLEPFETIKDSDFIIRLHPDEAPVLRHYVPQLAAEAVARLSERWAFTPKGPILIEVFPRHDDFAVRTLGLPGMIGALGACFGRVVIQDSPRARQPGEFNWGATLWHELAHVFTLQLSAQRVPRWLTEGISVYEEKQAHPEWGREMDVPFAQALDRGRVMKLRELNAGFSNPQLISLAYFQASLVVEHIVERFGQAKLRALVEAFAGGLDSEQAVARVLGEDIDALQQTFDGFVNRRYGKLRAVLAVPDGLAPNLPLDRLKAIAAAHPDSYPAQMALGEALSDSAPEAALAAYERAAALVPNAMGADSPHVRIAELALARGDRARAVRALETLTSYDHTDVVSARKLASLLDGSREPARLEIALRRVVAVDPFDAAAHSQLGRLALAAGRTDEAIRMFRVALAAGPVDKAGAHADLAESLAEAGRRDEARREVLAALEVAPTYRRAQDLLLKLAAPK